jgi:hypothetical protein
MQHHASNLARFLTPRNGFRSGCARLKTIWDRTAVAVLKDYLKWRGNLHQRETPLFLTFPPPALHR